MKLQRPQLLEDVATFARAHLESRDVDPAYPVVADVQRQLRFDPENAVWATLMYVAYYNLGSAVQVWLNPDLPVGSLPTGTERRGLRGGANMVKHIESLKDLRELYGSYTEWLAGLGYDWTPIRAQAELAWNNGRWASYKTAELLQEVNGWAIEAPDMGNDGSTGPRDGLRLLYGMLPSTEAADDAAMDLRDRLWEEHGLSITWSHLETVLCDFHALADGRYYVGHDIDLMWEQIMQAPPEVRELVEKARAATIPHQYLGELGGWVGVDRERCKAYQQSGAVLTR